MIIRTLVEQRLKLILMIALSLGALAVHLAVWEPFRDMVGDLLRLVLRSKDPMMNNVIAYVQPIVQEKAATKYQLFTGFRWFMAFGTFFSCLAALLFGMDVCAREVEEKTVDYSLTRPVSRARFMGERLLAGWVLTMLVIWIPHQLVAPCSRIFIEEQVDLTRVGLACVALSVVGSFFYAWTAAFSFIFKRRLLAVVGTLAWILLLWWWNEYHQSLKEAVPFSVYGFPFYMDIFRVELDDLSIGSVLLAGRWLVVESVLILGVAYGAFRKQEF